MILSFRQADLLRRYKEHAKKTVPVNVFAVFPQDENGNNDSDRDDAYRCILQGDIPNEKDGPVFYQAYAAINDAIAPWSLYTMNPGSTVYSDGVETMDIFQDRIIRTLTEKLYKISVKPIVDNYKAFLADEDIDRVKIEIQIVV